METPTDLFVYTLCLKKVSIKEIEKTFKVLNSEDQRRSKSFIKEEDRYRFLGGRYLILNHLLKTNETDQLQNLFIDEYRRPNLPKFHFSISHAKDRVVLATSDLTTAVGIDIEYKREIHVPNYLEPFSDLERQYIMRRDVCNRFYYCWTRKESVLKALGRGFLLEPQGIDILSDKVKFGKTKFHLMPLSIETQYSCHLCFDQENVKLSIHHL